MELKLKIYSVEYADFSDFRDYRIYRFRLPKLLYGGEDKKPTLVNFKYSDAERLSELYFDFEEECYVYSGYYRCGGDSYEKYYYKEAVHEAFKKGFAYETVHKDYIYFISKDKDDDLSCRGVECLTHNEEYKKIMQEFEEIKKRYEQESLEYHKKIEEREAEKKLKEKIKLYEQLKKELGKNE